MENLEARHLLAADAGIGAQWQNPSDRFDVNDDGRLTASDALVISNAMLANGKRRVLLTGSDLAKGSYPDVKLDGWASRADFDMALWEMNRRSRESQRGGGGFATLSGGENYPPYPNYGIANYLRWGESDEIDVYFGWDLFGDPDHEDWELTFTASVSGDTNIFDTITFNPSTGEYEIYYTVGEWGTGTVALRATDPEGEFAEVSFEVTSVLVEDYDLQWKDQGDWVDVPSDQGILTNDELRGRAHFTTIPEGFPIPIAWKHKDWVDASDDVDADDAVAGYWEDLLITDLYPDGTGNAWFEFQIVTNGDWGFTPEIDFGEFRYAAQMLPAKQENVYTIQDPVWEGIELSDGQTHFEANGNPPEFGAGDRFFAERNVPSGRPESVLHDSVNLVVSVDRHVFPGWHVLVATKIFDPDHYAPNPFDVNDTVGIVGTNWFQPRDNLKPGGQLTLEAGMGTDGTGGNLSTSVDILANTLSIKTPLQVLARQPTNDFKAAAFNPRVARANIDLAPNGTLIVRINKPGDLVPQTPRLMIWRHLYIELDSMEEPDLAQAPNPSIIAAGNITYVNGVTIKIDQEIQGPAFRFQGGEITILDANDVVLGTYSVAGNNIGVEPEIDLTVAVPAGAAKFINLKDDDFEHDVTALDMIPDVALFASRFRPACIEFDPAKDDLSVTSADPVSDLTQVDFDLNTNSADPVTGQPDELPGIHSVWRQSATEHDFWVAYVVGAFQPDETEDNDWDVEDATLGGSSKQVGISAIFRETLRDVAIEEPGAHVIGEDDLWRVVGLHEVGHQFNLGHDLTNDGPIMDYFSMQTEQVEELVFSPTGLRKITQRDFPREAKN